MFKHVEMQRGAHFTVVCTTLLIGLASKIQENFATQHVYVKKTTEKRRLTSSNRATIVCTY